MDSLYSMESILTSQGLTTSQAQATVGFFGILGGMVIAFSIVAIVIAILMIIAWWKIFTKAGEKGWKAIIPIYNAYIYCKIIGVSFWKWFIALFVLSFVSGFAAQVQWLSIILSIAYAVVVLIFYIIISRNTAKAFGKGTGFAVGLFFLPNIFQLILAFGSAEYQGVPSKE